MKYIKISTLKGLTLAFLAFISTTGFGSNTVDQPKFAEVSVGDKHSCALTENGRVFCWGDNSMGQIGIGKHIVGLDIPGEVLSEKTFRSVSAGSNHTCALSTDGQVYCWGSGQYGQNGNRDYLNEFTPKLVGVIGQTVQISAGADHTCAISNEMVGYCWGRGDSGQLGIAQDTDKVAIPTEVAFNSRIAKISSGGSHSCFLSESYVPYCFGLNSSGQIGQNNMAMAREPLPVKTLLQKKLTDISTGGGHTCVVEENGSALCFGDGSKGQLGNGATTSGSSPIAVAGGYKFLSVELGRQFSCGIVEEGQGFCWGDNSSQQLGTGNESPMLAEPTQVAGEIQMTGLSLGASHSCWVDSAGAAHCAGNGELGKLGTSGSASEPLPKKIEKVFSSIAKRVLEYCRSTPSRVIEIVKEIKNAKSCLDLALIADNIRSLDLESLELRDVSGIQVFANLVSLNLNNNAIQDLTPITKLRKLKEISLDHNKLTRKKGEVLRKARSLAKISIAHNELTDTSFIGTHPRSELKYVDASHNQIGDMIVGSYKYLEHIDLSYNKIEFPEYLGMLKNIKYLDISHNPMYVENQLNKLNLTGVFRATHTNLKELNMFKENGALNVQEIDISHTFVKDITMLRRHRHIKVFKAEKTPIRASKCPTDAASEAVWVYCSEK